jgi:hypothetical protein
MERPMKEGIDIISRTMRMKTTLILMIEQILILATNYCTDLNFTI